MKESFETVQNVKQASSYDEANFLLFESLNRIDTQIATLKYPPTVLYIYGLAATDYIASKSILALTVRRLLGHEVEKRILPRTYILSLKEDRDLIGKEHMQNKVYIMKKNIQRQLGCHITKSLHDIHSSYIKDREYVVVQEVLQNPFLVNGRKINLRVYLLIWVDEAKTVRFSIYNNGFIYYTPKPFEAYSTDRDKIITTGYIDRQVYVDNPLTLHDLQKFMGDVDYDIMFSHVIELMQHIKKGYEQNFKNHNKALPGTKFLIYGCDFAPDDYLNVKLMEINKGPDLSYKDERDKEVKFNMVKDAFGKVGLFPLKPDNQFVDIV
jgi:hypothetical protein